MWRDARRVLRAADILLFVTQTLKVLLFTSLLDAKYSKTNIVIVKETRKENTYNGLRMEMPD